jgi:hypothetical protein
LDRALAERVLDFLNLATGALNGAYRALHQAPDAEKYAEQQRRIAMLVALLGTGLVRQIHKEYPELCPAELRETLAYNLSAEAEWPLT